MEGLEKIMDHFLVPPDKKGKSKTKEEPPRDIKALDNKVLLYQKHSLIIISNFNV